MTKIGVAHELQRAAQNEAAQREAIRAMMDNYVAYFLAGDGERWLALFDKDALWMPPGEPWMTYDPFAKWAVSLRPGHAHAFENDILEIQIMGDWAFVTGTYTVSGPTDDGEPYRFDGKFLDILKRQDDGSWKISHCMFNLNTP